MKFRKSKLIKRGSPLSLYKTPDKLKLWLDKRKYLDKSIIVDGYFEKESTSLAKKLVKPGDVVIDVGANIGYYTILFAKLTSPNGKVLSFEPTEYYSKILELNINENEYNYIDRYKIALSDKDETNDIFIGDSSATMHWTADGDPTAEETIPLKRLDDIFDSLKIDKVDFIKVDIDGHEPQFLDGAWRTIDKYDPIVLLEVSHDNYVKAGFNAMDFYDALKKRNFHIYSEKTLIEYKNMREFLIECGNFTHSANIVISKSPINFSN